MKEADMNQNEYMITRFKTQVADMTEHIYALDFKCILLREENERLKARISELEEEVVNNEKQSEN